MSIKTRLEKLEKEDRPDVSVSLRILSSIPGVYHVPLYWFMHDSTPDEWEAAIEFVWQAATSGVSFTSDDLHFTVVPGLVWWVHHALRFSNEPENAQIVLDAWLAHQRKTYSIASETLDKDAVDFIPWWIRKDMFYKMTTEMLARGESVDTLGRFEKALRQRPTSETWISNSGSLLGVWSYGCERPPQKRVSVT